MEMRPKPSWCFAAEGCVFLAFWRYGLGVKPISIKVNEMVLALRIIMGKKHRKVTRLIYISL